MERAPGLSIWMQLIAWWISASSLQVSSHFALRSFCTNWSDYALKLYPVWWCRELRGSDDLPGGHKTPMTGEVRKLINWWEGGSNPTTPPAIQALVNAATVWQCVCIWPPQEDSSDCGRGSLLRPSHVLLLVLLCLPLRLSHFLHTPLWPQSHSTQNLS